MAAGITASAGLPPEKAATVTVLDDESTPVLYNDPAQTEQVKATLIKTFGPDKVFDIPRAMASEDVGVFALPAHQPLRAAAGTDHPHRRHRDDQRRHFPATVNPLRDSDAAQPILQSEVTKEPRQRWLDLRGLA
jgi:metal-dependent amidase/aminoacylase/carboxypeptidase family protein